jgi:hypothetical protein
MFRQQFQPTFYPRGAYPRAIRARPNSDFNDAQHHGTGFGIQQESAKSDIANTIFRAVFPANKSSCKQIVVALDPGMNFLPTVTLCKPGTRGVRMSRPAWVELMQNREKLTRFFKSARFEQDQTSDVIIKLDMFVHVELPCTPADENLASIVYEVNGGPRVAVAFKETTWQHIINLETIITHLLTRYNGYSPQVFKIFEGLAHFLFNKLEYVHGRDIQETLDSTNEILRGVDPKEFKNQEPDLDSFRAIEEMKLYCVNELLEACKRAER